MRIRVGFVLWALLALSVPSAVAQTVTQTTGAVNGTVTDASKAILPGVTVTLTGPSVMGSMTAVTDDQGFYRINAVPPGDFQLTYELAGFSKVIRQGVHVDVSFTATISVQMGVAALEESVTVSGASPVVDLQSNKVSTVYNAEKLAALPSGALDYWNTALAQTPAVALGNVDVGGSNALTQQGYTAYGTSGGARANVEGMNVQEGTGGGGTDMYYTDFSSFVEVAVSPVGNTAEMPTAGTFGQLVSKSGGNAYHGSVFYNYENQSLEWHNIDPSQSGILNGVAANGESYTDINRLKDFSDFTADIGGFIVKDKLWWYAGFRDTVTDLRFTTLIGDPQHTKVPVVTAKATYNLNTNNKLIAYYQRVDKIQSDYLGGLHGGSIQTNDTTWSETFPVGTWKGEYDAQLGKAAFLEVRAGNWFYDWGRFGKGNATNTLDSVTGIINGTNSTTDLIRNRYQTNGALSYFAHAAGEHNLKVGYEVMDETAETTFFAPPDNLSLTYSNGVPSSVILYNSGGDSKSGLWTYSGYAQDTWRVNSRLTINLGLRFDRYRQYLPAQNGPAESQFANPAFDFASPASFAAVNVVNHAYNQWAPRFGAVIDLTGKGKTVLKVNAGQYWANPGASAVNPNSTMWSQTWRWSDPTNAPFSFSQLTGSQPTSVSGGASSTLIDPNIKDPYQLQGLVYIEHELLPNLGIRTGVVWNGTYNSTTTLDPNRPNAAYDVATAIKVPGTNGVIGANPVILQGFGLDPAVLAISPVNYSTQAPDAVGHNETWEITATQRRRGRLSSLTAGYSATWFQARGAQINPNSCINLAPGCWSNTSTWQAKINAAVELPWALHFSPAARIQSGKNFADTFSTGSLNYSGSVTINADAPNTNRTPTVAVFDLRSERVFRVMGKRASVFFDLYNITNTNAVQSETTVYGGSYLRPANITAPRIARFGVKFDW